MKENAYAIYPISILRHLQNPSPAGEGSMLLSFQNGVAPFVGGEFIDAEAASFHGAAAAEECGLGEFAGQPGGKGFNGVGEAVEEADGKLGINLLAENVQFGIALADDRQGGFMFLQEGQQLILPGVIAVEILVPIEAIGAENEEAVAVFVLICVGGRGVGAVGHQPQALHQGIRRQRHIIGKRLITAVLADRCLHCGVFFLPGEKSLPDRLYAGVDAFFLQDPCGGKIEDQGLFKDGVRQIPGVFAEGDAGAAGAVIHRGNGIVG